MPVTYSAPVSALPAVPHIFTYSKHLSLFLDQLPPPEGYMKATQHFKSYISDLRPCEDRRFTISVETSDQLQSAARTYLEGCAMMLSTHLTLLSLITIASGSTIPDLQPASAGPFAYPMSQTIQSIFDGIEDLAFRDNDSEQVLYEFVPSLEERDISFGQQSRVVNLDGLFQWTFGDATNHYNISIDKCIRLGDAVGVWDFEDGSRKYNASLGEIMADLGIGKDYGSPARSAARLLSNDILAHNEGRDYLEGSVLCKGNSTSPTKRRDLLIRDNGDSAAGFKVAMLKKTVLGFVCGLAVQEISNRFHADWYQLTAGAMGGAAVVLGLDIIAYRQIRGRYNDWESWMGGAWTAFLRGMVYLANGAPTVEGPCRQETELVAMEGQLAQASDSALRLAPLGPPIGRAQSCPTFH